MSEPGNALARLKTCKNNLRALSSSSPGSEEFLKAKFRVAEAQLDVAEEKLDEAEEKLRVAEAKEDTPEQRSEIAKAEVGVAKAKVGVAEARVGVAEAHLRVAEAKEDTPGRQSEIAEAKVGVAEARVGVAKAEWDFAIAVYNAEAKTSSPERLGFLQGQIEDRKEVYKRLQGRVPYLYFRALHVSRVLAWLAFLLTVIELARLCVQILLFACTPLGRAPVQQAILVHMCVVLNSCAPPA